MTAVFTDERLRMAKAGLPIQIQQTPIDPRLSPEELLAIVRRLYHELGDAPDRRAALTAQIRAHADRYRQVDEQAQGHINQPKQGPHPHG